MCVCVGATFCRVPGLRAQTGSTQHGTGEGGLHLYNTVHQGMELVAGSRHALIWTFLKLL